MLARVDVEAVDEDHRCNHLANKGVPHAGLTGAADAARKWRRVILARVALKEEPCDLFCSRVRLFGTGAWPWVILVSA